MSQSSILDVPELHLAIRKGQFQDIRYMVSHGEDVNVRDPAEHRTPLMLCAMIDQEAWGVGIARMLLAKGAMVGYSDRRAQNALMTACIHGRPELVNVFLKAVDYDPNQRDRYGNTALFYAASNGNVEVAEALVASLLHFKLTLDKANKWGMTPFLEACRLGHHIIAQLLEKHGAAVDVQDVILHWGPAEWRHDREQREIDEAPRSRSYDKPWLRNKESQTKNLKRSVSITSTRNGSDGLPSIPLSRTSHRSEVDDDVFHPPTIVISQTKSENVITDSPRTRSRDQKKLPSTATKRRMLFKPWTQDLTKGQVITAVFSPAPATSDSLEMHTTPNASSSCSLIRQRMKNSRNQNSDWPASCHFQNNFKQIFQRYEIQSSDSFRQRAKTPEPAKIPEIHMGVDQQATARNAHALSKLTRQQSRMNMNSSNRLSSSSSSMDLNAGRKSKMGDLRARVTDRAKPEDSASSVSSEDSAAAKMMMNAFRKRRTSVAQAALSDK